MIEVSKNKLVAITSSSESLEAMFVAHCVKVAACDYEVTHAATLSHVRVAHQSRATKSQV